MSSPLIRERPPSSAPSAPVHRLNPVPALDGLRGLAVAAVVAFHYPTRPWFRGGLFGVGIFFVLSGFLVTAGLLDQADRDGPVDVGGFLGRRAWRLLPALLLLLTAFLILAAGFGHQPWFSSNPFGNPNGAPLHMSTALAGAGIALSWWYNVILARSWVTSSPLGHLWTLSLEVQFYVGVAVVVALAVRARLVRWLLPVTLALAACSAAAPFFLWHHGHGRNEIYFGTWTNMQQLLGGAALALAWRRGLFDRMPSWVVRLIGAVSGATLLWLLFKVGDVPFKYLGALTVVTVATAGVVLSCVVAGAGTGAGGGPSSRGICHPVLTWLGRRAYGIYLWHWPLAEWTNRLPHSFGVPLGISLSLALAEASWRLVEQPAIQFSKRRVSGRRLVVGEPRPGVMAA